MTSPFPPELAPLTSTLVGVHWLKTIPGLPTQQINTTLPSKQNGTHNYAVWADTGFIQVSVASGSPHLDLPVGEPVLDIVTWATSATSKKIPWRQANDLAARIIAATYDPAVMRPSRRRVPTPPGYPDARVTSAYATTDPRQVDGDEAHLGGYQFDLKVHYVAIPVQE
ncbi:hypothetical protein ACFVWN_01060 [Nocardiopsis flavescens]|uniref:hypothetical protein n=1 Tax=Nocardiopsis flavescens TaxID=758803 RepID=UPI0036619E48